LTPPQLWLARHGETEWSAAGLHTSRTDVPLTPAGEKEAAALQELLGGQRFDLVLSSPMVRATSTAVLAGFEPEITPDLHEWDYGELEGLTTEEIRAQYPGWSVWYGPWPSGEDADHVSERADRVVARARALGQGARALLFAHGHILRVVTARWLGLPADQGKHFLLRTATLGVLSWEREEPVVDRWDLAPADWGASQRT
jgi:broad specificity phosphatase PhoE